MQPSTPPAATFKGMVWAGRVLSTILVLLMLLDGIMKLWKPPEVVKATVELGYPEDVILGLGILVLVCTVLYAIPRTAVLGAVLLTGWLGGATASHLRHGDPLLFDVIPAVFGALVWGALYLRDARVRALLPVTRRA